MSMKKVLLVLVLFLSFVSCSQEDRRAFVAFHRIVEADSLYAIGKTEEAESLLDEVLKQNNEMEYPTVMKRLEWAILSDVNKEEGSLYYDYIFLYMAQMDAIAMKNNHEEDPLKKIGTMKRLFTLAPDFDIIIENYLNWESMAKNKKNGQTSWLTLDAAYSVFSPFIKKYNEYLSKVQKTYCFAGNRWELPFYLYRVKWIMMNTLLIESDKELGYEKTFSYFDSILEDHGASFQEYTKALVKSYMSFSGIPKYEYKTEMGYDEFKTIVSDSGSWFTAWLHETKGGKLLLGREIIPQSGGILVECGGRFIWNPTETSIPFLWDDDTIKLVTIDGSETKEIFLNKENRVLWKTSSVNIPKSLLCALLYRHGMGEYVPLVLESKQYNRQNVLVREGEENGYKKVVQYKNNSEIEWRLFNFEGLPVCDSMGAHCRRVEETEDSTTIYYYDSDMLLRKEKPAYEVSYHYGKYEDCYYDREGNLYRKEVDDTVTYYKNSDSIRITIDYNYNTSFTVVTTEFLSCLDSSNRPTKKVEVFNGWYDEETDLQYGDVVLVQHPSCDCFGNKGSNKWPFEQRWYDEEHRIISIAFFDGDKMFQGGIKYLYKDNNTIIAYYYDSNNWLFNSETLIENE